jgi:ferredoxin-thioredoxin reductase catalytic subunit
LTSVEKVRLRAESDAKAHGYYLNPDPEFLNSLLEGLKDNEERYGYPSCPCRLAAGRFDLDRDIICPCDYRDPDVEDFGACYCALYVDKDIYEGKTPVRSIPERRPVEKQVRAYEAPEEVKKSEYVRELVDEGGSGGPKMKMWVCKQCGYVCFREDPPYICPICKAKREFFAEIKFSTRAFE